MDLNTSFETAQLKGRQDLQASQYEFPYHYIPQFETKVFLSRHWPFADSYLAALELVARRLRPLVNDGNYHHIDIGCGDGALVHYLTRLPGFATAKIVGVDIDKRSISWAKMFNPNTELHAGEMAALANGYSSATLIEVIEHIPPDDLPDFLETAAKRLIPGGLMLITVPSVEKPVAEKHFQHFSFDTLRSLIEPQFDIDQLFGFERKDIVTRIIDKLRTNRIFRLDAPLLNRIAVDRLARQHETQRGCGRLFAVCRRKIDYGTEQASRTSTK